MSSDKRQARNVKLYIAGGILVLLAGVVFAQQAFDLQELFPHDRPDQILQLYTLSTLIFVVLLVFGFILLRTLVKVWVERKQGKPGSRFKVSLLAMLGVLPLVPAVSVFDFAYGLTNRSIDKWMSAPVDQIFKTNDQIEAIVLKQQQEYAQATLNYLAANVPSDFQQARNVLQLKALVLMRDDGNVEAGSVEPGVDLGDLARQVVASRASRESFVGLNGHWLATRTVETAGGKRTLAAVFPARQDLAASSAEIDKQKVVYDQLKSGKNVFRNIYGTVLLLMTVLV